MTIKVALTANLQSYYPEARFEIEAFTVRELLLRMDEKRPLFSRYILEDDGTIRKHVNIFVGGELVAREKGAVDARLSPGCQVHIMQALSGG